MEQQRGFERVVFFSDAVVAIAMTLLVLPLVDLASEVEETGAADLISQNSDKLFVFFLSFVVIARFWAVHHAIFANLRGYNRPIVVANFLWLCSIAFLPFPTELVGAGKVDTTIAGLYVGTMAVSALATAAIQLLVVRSLELQVPEVRGTLSARPALFALAVMVVAFVLAATVGAVGLWAILLLIPASLLDRATRSA